MKTIRTLCLLAGISLSVLAAPSVAQASSDLTASDGQQLNHQVAWHRHHGYVREEHRHHHWHHRGW